MSNQIPFEEGYDPFYRDQGARRPVRKKVVLQRKKSNPNLGELGSGMLRPEKTKLDIRQFAVQTFLPQSKDKTVEKISEEIESSIEERIENARQKKSEKGSKGIHPTVKVLLIAGSSALGIGLIFWIMKKNPIHKKNQS